MISYRYCTGGSKGLGPSTPRNQSIAHTFVPPAIYYIYIGVISALLDLIIKHSGYRFHHRSTRDIMNLIFKPRSLSLAPFSEISFAPRTFRSHLYIFLFVSYGFLLLALITFSWNIEFQSNKILLSRTYSCIFALKFLMIIVRFIFYSGGTDE